MSSDTIETPNHTEPEKVRTFHVKAFPSDFEALAVYARKRGMRMAGVIREARELITSKEILAKREAHEHE